MHSSIHSLAHRAPPATRTRVRWQPYNALSASSSSSISSRSPSLSTPATSVLPSPPPKATPLCEPERLKAQSSMPQTPRDPSTLRENPKTKYATGLVDQAVKSLCEIWRPQDIPNVFLTSSRATVGSELPPPPQSRCSTKLPSPLSPLAQGSPACSRAGSSGLQCDQDRTNLVPIKGFVHEVLRRSRTSGSVLQTALCYLEAVRSKVPELIRKEQSGEGTRTEFDADTRVMPATPAELEQEARWAELASTATETAAEYQNEEDVMDTVRISDEDIACTATPFTAAAASDDVTPQKSTSSLATPASLPSPLLCPRRAFLASLILASKFTQDKCYSNRAWAKLSGLPAREIGRCERALGDALEWRLWVGKTLATAQAQAAPSPTTTTAATTSRPVARCQSESSLSFGKGPFLPRNDKKECIEAGPAASSSPTASRRALRRLGGSSTLPAEAFTAKARPVPSSSGSQYEPTCYGEGHQLSFLNIAQQDQFMGSPECSQSIDSPSTPSSYSQQFSSPTLSTPGLSYSPSSTESSSGDRTIQMSSFMDDNMSMAPQQDNVFVAGGSDLALQGSWGAMAPSSPTLSGIAFEATLGYPPHAPYTSLEYAATTKFVAAAAANKSDAWPWGEVSAEEFGAGVVPTPAYGYAHGSGLAAKFIVMPASSGLPQTLAPSFQ